MNAVEIDLLRVATAGSVDDGKSTLIGRLLFDSKSILDDHLEAIERTSKKMGHDYTDLSLLTDGLRAEREQGITIDVAYRYFATAKRKFIVADTPGHLQYTRNMVTGASTANLGLILVDARKGLSEQSRRHAVLLSLLRVPNILLCVNKMDLVGYSEATFAAIDRDFTEFMARLQTRMLASVPISALTGDNVATPSKAMSWYRGPSLLGQLEDVRVEEIDEVSASRFPVQYVVRPHREGFPDYRGYAGQVAGGSLKKNDRVTILPSGLETRVAGIDLFGREIEEAFAPMSVIVRLEDEIDVGRGDLITRSTDLIRPIRHIEAMICWMSSTPLAPGRSFRVKHTTNSTKATVKRVFHRLDVNSLTCESDANELAFNEVGKVLLHTSKPLMADPYEHNRITGSFILIDEDTGETAGAGMIL